MFHDMRLTHQHSSAHERCEVDGANAARDFLRRHGICQQDIEVVWTAIALHTLYRHRRIHRSRFCALPSAGFSIRAAPAPSGGDAAVFLAKPSTYPALEKLIGGTVNTKQINAHWEEILRLAASIQQGTVTASLMLRKLGAYPRRNALPMALRELGKLERTLFLLEYIRDVELRRRIHIGLNKGETRNALARAVFFNRLGELREPHIGKPATSGQWLKLNLVVAATIGTRFTWSGLFKPLRNQGQMIPEALLVHLSPLKWEHINVTYETGSCNHSGPPLHRPRPFLS
jgi:hypothetical protein